MPARVVPAVLVVLCGCSSHRGATADSGTGGDAAIRDDAAAGDAAARDAASVDGPAGGWQSEPAPGGTTVDLRGVWGSGGDDVYTVGADTILHSAGNATWTVEPSPYVSEALYAVWGSGPGSVDAVGEDAEADTWCLFASTGNGTWAKQQDEPGGQCHSRGIWGTGPKDIYVAQQLNGLIDHWDGTGWTTQFLPIYVPALAAIWGTSDSDLYVAGSGGMIFHSAGAGSWVQQTSPTTADLHGIWGSGPHDVYAVGDGGTILHSAGDGTWTVQASGTTGALEAAWGSAGRIYAVGAGGVVLRSDGTGTWTAESVPTTEHLYGVWGSGPADVYVVGAHATILHGPG